MRSRTSLFNKTVLLKDITRFCPVWIIFLVLNILPALGNISSALMTSEENYLAAQLAWGTGSWALISFGYAMVCALLLFGDLFKSRMCNALHALPLRRESWFATHVLAGLLFFLVPSALVALICLPFLGQYWFVAPLWLLAVTIMFLFFFALAILCIMLTGGRFAASAVYLLINFFSMLCYWMVETYYAPLLPGLHIRDDVFEWLSPLALLTRNDYFLFEQTEVSLGELTAYPFTFQGLTEQWLYLGIIGILAIALFALALVLYKKRKLECAGNFLAFPKTQPVFLVIFALAVGAMFQTIFNLFDSSIVSMIIGIVIGSYTGQMLLRRTVRVFDKRSFFWCGSLACALILTLALTEIDPLGLTRWTPEPEQVTSITLSDNYEFEGNMEYSGVEYYYEYDGGVKYYYGYDKAITVTDPEDIAKIVSVHQRILSQEAYIKPEAIYQYNPYLAPVHITYHMADGRDVVRRYYVSSQALYQELEPFFSAAQFLLGFSDFNAFASHVGSVSLDGEIIHDGMSEFTSLLEAVWADCKEGTLYQGSNNFNYSSGHWITIHTDTDYIELEVFSNSENTLKWIKNRKSTQ